MRLLRLPQRRNYFIDKRFQSWFVSRFLAVLMAGGAVTGYLVYMMVGRDVERLFYSSHIRVSSTGQLLVPTLLKVNFGVLTAVFIVAALMTLYVSRRLNAPLFRLGRTAARVGSGDLRGGFRVREGDEIGPLSNAFSGMNAGLRDRIDELKGVAHEMDMAAEKLLFQHAYLNIDQDSRPDDEQAERLACLEDSSEAFRKCIEQFKLKG